MAKRRELKQNEMKKRKILRKLIEENRELKQCERIQKRQNATKEKNIDLCRI